jgi:hypothetical protein
VLQGVSGPIVRLNAIYCNNSVEKDPVAIRFFEKDPVAIRFFEKDPVAIRFFSTLFGGFVGKQRLANRK